ncbi:hypothetical protein GCM10027521_14940 [Amycolatopsis cihanbeyliensis]
MLAQGGYEGALSLFNEIESLYLEGVRESDPAWDWWIDERELAWHKAMAIQSLGRGSIAITEFEHSVEATDPTETRQSVPTPCLPTSSSSRPRVLERCYGDHHVATPADFRG